MAINRIDLTNVSNSMSGIVTTDFDLTDLSDGILTTIKLANGRSEEFGGQIYEVNTSDYQVTDSGIADGTVFIHLKDNGDGTCDAFMSSSSGNFDYNKNGWYNGNDKVLFSMIKSGLNYSNKGKMLKPENLGEIISIHPDTLFFPNPHIYELCDGVALLDTNNFSTANDTKVPDLSDNRFLQGSSVYGVGGNANNQVDFSHSHTLDTVIGAVGQGGTIGPQTGTHTHTPSTSLSATQDIRPLYFNVKYYIRVR